MLAAKLLLLLWPVLADASGTLLLDLRRTIKPGSLGDDVSLHARDAIPGTIATNMKNKYMYSYEITINVGSDNQSVTVNVDTASTDLWFRGIGHNFNPYTSKSFRNLSIPWRAAYMDGSRASGFLAMDNMGMNGIPIENVTFALASEASNNGIIGLSYQEDHYTTFLQSLKQNEAIQQQAFSLYLNGAQTDHGQLLFGGVDHAKYNGTLGVVPIVNRNGLTKQRCCFFIMWNGVNIRNGDHSCQFLEFNLPAGIDSGTSYAFLPPDIVDNLAKAINYTFGAHPKYYTGNCDLSDTGVDSFELNFSGVKIQVPPETLLDTFTDSHNKDIYTNGKRQCQLAISRAGSVNNIILGDVFLRNFYAVFDLDSDEIGLANAILDRTDVSDIEAITSGIPKATSAPLYSSTILDKKIKSRTDYGSCIRPTAISSTARSSVVYSSSAVRSSAAHSLSAQSSSGHSSSATSSMVLSSPASSSRATSTMALSSMTLSVSGPPSPDPSSPRLSPPGLSSPGVWSPGLSSPASLSSATPPPARSTLASSSLASSSSATSSLVSLSSAMSLTARSSLKWLSSVPSNSVPSQSVLLSSELLSAPEASLSSLSAATQSFASKSSVTSVAPSTKKELESITDWVDSESHSPARTTLLTLAPAVVFASESIEHRYSNTSLSKAGDHGSVSTKRRSSLTRTQTSANTNTVKYSSTSTTHSGLINIPKSTHGSEISATPMTTKFNVNSSTLKGQQKIETEIEVVRTLITTCSGPTIFTTNGATFTAKNSTVFTITDCPCTITREIDTIPADSATHAAVDKTQVVWTLITTCSEPTNITTNGKVYTVAGPTVLTITDCPCTVTHEGLHSTKTATSGGFEVPTQSPMLDENSSSDISSAHSFSETLPTASSQDDMRSTGSKIDTKPSLKFSTNGISNISMPRLSNAAVLSEISLMSMITILVTVFI